MDVVEFKDWTITDVDFCMDGNKPIAPVYKPNKTTCL